MERPQNVTRPTPGIVLFSTSSQDSRQKRLISQSIHRSERPRLNLSIALLGAGSSDEAINDGTKHAQFRVLHHSRNNLVVVAALLHDLATCLYKVAYDPAIRVGLGIMAGFSVLRRQRAIH
jgi:hypothetical protein